MPLYHNNNGSDSDADMLATEARKQLTQLADLAFTAYANCRNYEINNGKGVTAEDFKKAFGEDRKDFESVMRAMKRLLVTINPDFKERLAPLTKKIPESAA